MKPGAWWRDDLKEIAAMIAIAVVAAVAAYSSWTNNLILQSRARDVAQMHAADAETLSELRALRREVKELGKR